MVLESAQVARVLSRFGFYDDDGCVPDPHDAES